MPEWLIWTLIVAAVVVIVLLIGKGQVNTSAQNHRFSDRYNPVYLQQQELHEAARHAPTDKS